MKQITVALVTAMALALGVVSCTGSDVSPSSNPPPAPSPTITGVAVTGNAPSVGASAQFTATASLSNGTSQPVTSQASWQSSDPNVASVSATGLVTAVAGGAADIRASYQNVTGTTRITVAPVSRMFGIVYLAGGSSTLSSVNVRIVDGPNAGKSSTTDGSGNYSISNVTSGTFGAEASRSGYVTASKGVTLSGDLRVDFVLSTGGSSPSPSPSPTPPPSNPSPAPPGSMQCTVGSPIAASCGTATAICNDNIYSCSKNRSGTCSQHGGVKCWICPGPLCNP